MPLHPTSLADRIFNGVRGTARQGGGGRWHRSSGQGWRASHRKYSRHEKGRGHRLHPSLPCRARAAEAKRIKACWHGHSAISRWHRCFLKWRCFSMGRETFGARPMRRGTRGSYPERGGGRSARLTQTGQASVCRGMTPRRSPAPPALANLTRPASSCKTNKANKRRKRKVLCFH
jgi:hypothetical protein